MPHAANDAKPPAREPLAIVGMGCLFPKAASVEAYWANILGGVDCISEVPPSHWDPADYFDADPKRPDMTYARRGGFIDPVLFDCLAYGIPPDKLEATDTTQLLGLVATRQALRDAGYESLPGAGDGRTFDRDRTSCILGVTGTLELVIPLGARLGHPRWRRALREAGVDGDTAEDVVARIADSYVPWQENSFPGLLGNVAAGRIANRYDFGGTNTVCDAACASSLSAVAMAAMELWSGRSDLAVTGGIDTFNDIFMYLCFSKTPALSKRGDARPFAADGDGTILGEGLGMVVLKRLADAQRDGDRIHALLRGIGSSSDGAGNAIYAPSATGQQKALRRAYADAGVSPRDIGLVEAHGTGTVVGDGVELGALSEVYREAGEGTWCALGSVKSQIGHTKAAAGVASLIKAVLACEHRVLPPTIKVDTPLPAARPGTAPLYLNTVARPWTTPPGTPRRAALSSFGFGGSNFHCVLEESGPQARAPTAWDPELLLLVHGADDDAGLALILDEHEAALHEPATDWRARAQLGRSGFAASAACRLAIVTTRTGLGEALTAARALLAQPGAWQEGTGVALGRGPTSGGLAWCFPGQGSQRVGMLRELSCCFDELQRALAAADAAAPAAISPFIHPIPVFDAAERRSQEAALTCTDRAQPALGAVEAGVVALLRRFGVAPDACAGHSFGELVALHAAGHLSAEALHSLARCRGAAMAACGEAGGMLAVKAAPEAIAAAFGEWPADLVIANRNAPQQTVLAGPQAALDEAEAELREAGLRGVRLPVAAAFHSPLVADALGPVAAAVAAVDWQAGSVPVWANATGGRYPADPGTAKDLLARQLGEGVRWVDQVRGMAAAGIRTFVECGPGRVLGGLIRSIVGEADSAVFALEDQEGRQGLAWLLARLAARGHEVALSAWDGAYRGEVSDGRRRLLVPICGANHVKERPARPPRPAPIPAAAPAAATAPPPLTAPATTLPEALVALQHLQQQTAALHQQFLQGQETAHRALATLLGTPQPPAAEPLPPTSTPAAPPVATAPHTQTPPAPPATPAPTAPTTNDQRPTTEHTLLSVIAEKTGYPKGMLTADMRLDDDLGIDSIKRVEILSAFQDAVPDATPVPPERLGDLQTIADVIAALRTQAPTAPTATTAPTAPTTNDQRPQTEQTLLAVIAEKTGYPMGMLTADMRLDDDLGIDSIKRVEILSAFQDAVPDATPVPPERLGDLQTIADVIAALHTRTPTAPTATTAPTAPTTNDQRPTTEHSLLAVIAEKTGYPKGMLTADMRLDDDLGIDSIKRVEILSAFQDAVPDATPIPPERLGDLQTIADVVAALRTQTSSAPAATVAPTAPRTTDQGPGTPKALRMQAPTSIPWSGPVTEGPLPAAAIWLAGDAAVCTALAALLPRARVLADPTERPTGPCAALVLIAPPAGPADWLGTAFELLQHAGRHLATGGRLLGVVRLDGSHGHDAGDLPAAPLPAGLTGMIKTAGHEWPSIDAVACDCAATLSATEVATALQELLQAEAPGEVGFDGAAWRQVVLEPCPQRDGSLPLSAEDTVVVSGGARGVTAAVAVELARRCGCGLLLLGRSAAEPEPEWAGGIADTELQAAALQAGVAATPKALATAVAAVTAARAIAATLAAVADAGGRARYATCDVTDAAAVERVLGAARRDGARLRGLVHGAGILADRLIETQTRAQFDAVVGVKLGGLQHLLTALRDDGLAVIVGFSSSTGRFGRKGQVAYAAANSALDKVLQAEARRRPDCVVRSLAWGPWNGGMVTPALAAVFAAEGVGLIDLEAGAACCWQACSDTGPIERVVLATAPDSDDDSGIERATAPVVELSPVFQRTLSVASHPILRDHVLAGRAVLPAALMLEWLVHGATVNSPGLTLRRVEQFRIFEGVTLLAEDELAVQIASASPEAVSGGERVVVELSSTRGRHAVATVHMGVPPELGTDEAATPTGTWSGGTLYEAEHLFHGPALQLIDAVRACGPEGLVLRLHRGGPPGEWMERPLRRVWQTAPDLIDAALQAAIVWSQAQLGAPCLPVAIASYEQATDAWPEQLDLVLRVVEHRGARLVVDVLIRDAVSGRVQARLGGSEHTVAASLGVAFRTNRLAQEVR